MSDTYSAKPSEAFLAEVLERARRYGWCGDYIEVANFVRWLYKEAELQPPSRAELEPYDPVEVARSK